MSALETALDNPGFKPPEPLPVTDREALRAALRPHQDELVIAADGHRATFLPKVWEQLPNVDDFLHALWEKAGLRAAAWPDGIHIERCAAFDFGEH